MKISLDWLKEFVNIPNIPDEDLAQKIIEHCFEVEKIIKPGQSEASQFKFSNVIVAKVLSWQKHPNADRLRIVKLDIGEGKIIDPVVCGAANFDAGSLVALALPGADIPQNIHSEQHESFVLGKAKIRGIESQGMICSAFELALREKPEEMPEIMVLSGQAKLGEDLQKHLESLPTNPNSKNSDTVFDLALPANRPDLFSHFGIARELSAILGYKLTSLGSALNKIKPLKLKTKGSLKIKIEKKSECPYYIGMRVSVKVGESPEFIKKRLGSLGLRPINNVVDITNYLTHGLGSPMHAFDAAKVKGNITVRAAKQGEKIVTLDHKEKILEAGTLVIADESKALAIAGIMGGLESEVTGKTTEIILEAANFEATAIRKTSKKLSLRTDSSSLWEKGLSPLQAQINATRALHMLEEHAQGKLQELAEAGNIEISARSIKFSVEEINSLIGQEFSAAEVKKYLKAVGLELKGKAVLSVKIPYYRMDMETYADLAEEIIKIIGLNKIPKKPLAIQKKSSHVNADQKNYGLKQHMVEMGFSEVQNYSFISESDAKKFHGSLEGLIKVKNPLSADQGYLKKNLLIPLLKNVASNSRFQKDFKIFEIGSGYQGYLAETPLLTFVIYDESFTEQKLFAEAKGAVNMIIKKYFNQAADFKANPKNLLDIIVGGKTIGNVGPVWPNILKSFDIEKPLAYAKLNLNELFKAHSAISFEKFNKFPNSVLDISLIAAKNTEWQKILDLINSSGRGLIKDVQIFEADYFYPKGKAPEFHKKLAQTGKKNIAFHLIFEAPGRTLSASEIAPIYAKIIEELKLKLGAEIR